VAHAGFGGLLHNALVREDPDPQLATALDVAGDGNTARLNLTLNNAAVFCGLETKVPKRERAAAVGQAAHAAFAWLAPLHA